MAYYIFIFIFIYSTYYRSVQSSHLHAYYHKAESWVGSRIFPLQLQLFIDFAHNKHTMWVSSTYLVLSCFICSVSLFAQLKGIQHEDACGERPHHMGGGLSPPMSMLSEWPRVRPGTLIFCLSQPQPTWHNTLGNALYRVAARLLRGSFPIIVT